MIHFRLPVFGRGSAEIPPPDELPATSDSPPETATNSQLLGPTTEPPKRGPEFIAWGEEKAQASGLHKKADLVRETLRKHRPKSK